MKRLFLLIYAFAAINSYSQIKIASPSSKKEHKAQYDSLHNYIGGNILAYIGQQLYIKPKNESLQKYGYEGFYSQPLNDRKYIYKRTSDYSYFSDYAQLAGKTFTCIGISKRKFELGMVPPKIYGMDGLDNDYYYFLKLANANDTIYYEYTKYEHDFPFITLGYLDKLKKQYSRKLFILKKQPDNILHDFDNGNEVNLVPGSIWSFKDVILDNKYYNITLLFTNKNKETIPVEDYRFRFTFIEKSSAEKIKQKYGNNLYNLAINGTIKIGMTKELVKLAWGEPSRINFSSYGEQWVYNNQYIYFKNGKVTDFN